MDPVRSHPVGPDMATWIWAGIAVVAAIVCLALLADWYERHRDRRGG